MERRDIAHIMRATIDAAIHPGQWDQVCDMIAEHAGLNAFFLYEYAAEQGTIPSMHISEAIRRDGRQLIDALQRGEGGPAEEVLYASTMSLEPCRIVFEHETLGLSSEDQLPANPFRDGILSASTSRRRFGARLNDIGPFIDIGSGHTDRPRKDFSAQQLAELELVFNVLGKSFEAGRVVRKLIASYHALLSFFDSVDFGAAFCDDGGRIVIANRHFDELAAERDGLTNMAGIAGATHPDDQHRFREIMETTVRPGPRPDSLIMRLQRRSQELPLIARTMAVREPQVGLDAPLVLLLVIDPEGRHSLDSGGIAAFGMLSPAELEICDLLIKGAGTVEIAERRSTKTETTRGQIKTISAKLACRNRLDLIRLAMMTSTPVKDLDTP